MHFFSELNIHEVQNLGCTTEVKQNSCFVPKNDQHRVLNGMKTLTNALSCLVSAVTGLKPVHCLAVCRQVMLCVLHSCSRLLRFAEY